MDWSGDELGPCGPATDRLRLGMAFILFLLADCHTCSDSKHTCFGRTFHCAVRLYCQGFCKGKDLPQQAEVAQGVPGRLRSRIFLTFGTTASVLRYAHSTLLRYAHSILSVL
jgi:hypothetical protein